MEPVYGGPHWDPAVCPQVCSLGGITEGDLRGRVHQLEVTSHDLTWSCDVCYPGLGVVGTEVICVCCLRACCFVLCQHTLWPHYLKASATYCVCACACVWGGGLPVPPVSLLAFEGLLLSQPVASYPCCLWIVLKRACAQG